MALKETLVVVAALCSTAQAGGPCRVGFGNYGGYAANADYTPVNGETGLYKRADGTYWLDGVEQEQVRVQLKYRTKEWPDGWKPGFIPKVGARQLGTLLPYAQQGATAFGYSSVSQYSTPSFQVSAAAVQPDPAQFMNYAFRLGEQQNNNSREGYERFLAAASKLNQDSQDTDRIIRTAEAFALAVQATNPTRVERTLTAGAQQLAGTEDGRYNSLISVLNKCTKCHTGDAVSRNGFDVVNWASMNAEQWDEVVRRVTSHGEDRMPKNSEPLAPMELLPLLEHAARLHSRSGT